MVLKSVIDAIPVDLVHVADKLEMVNNAVLKKE